MRILSDDVGHRLTDDGRRAEGFSYMASFNAELDTEPDRLHPKSRELIGQSLSPAQEKTGAAFAAPV